jgi:hypothetical protein
MESFFSSLKTERTARKVYRSRSDAKADVFDYIERFYTRRDGVRRWATSARSSTNSRRNELKGVSTEPVAGHVIPSVHKWAHDFTVARIIAERLKSIHLETPPVTVDLINISRRYHTANGRAL